MSETKKTTKKKLKVSPMFKYVKNCLDERVVWDNGIAYVERWLYLPQDFPCGGCNQTGGVRFMRCTPGVFRTCKYCNYTEEVLPRDPSTGEELARLLERQQISVNEAWKILERDMRQKFPPAGLPSPRGRRVRAPLPENIETE